MIKRCLISLLLLFVATANSFGADYVGKEKKYFFSADNIGQSIIAHVEDEDKQVAVAQEYVKIMDPATGNVSIEDLFAICRIAGFNTYKEDGYNKCRGFITTLLENAQIEADSGIMGGYCPGLDENGKNPNNLQTITDKTRIGDSCKSTNIYAGEVVFKKGYNCTCMAYACNPGFYIKGGACHTEVADSGGNCLRKEYPGNDSNNSKDKCFAFCGQQGEKQGCKANTSIWFPKDNKCLCNATYDEVDAVRQARIEALPYRAVCGADKGKTGGTEYCIKDIFNWTNVGMIQATGLAAEYALIKHGKVVHCSDKYRQESNDDWVQCTTDDKKTFYEFKFDDVIESVDARIQGDLTKGICQIHGMVAVDSNGSGYYDSCSGACGEALKKSAKKFGLNPVDKTLYNSTYCSLQDRRLGKNEESKLATLEGIDNKIFYHGIQIQGNQDLIRKLRQYIQSTGKYEIKSFTCDKGVGKIKNGNIETDDILRCYLNGQPIDFVFDDNSEMWKTYQKAGKQAINCIVQGGTYSGKGCLGLSEQVCLKVAAQDKKSCPECQAAHWDANLEQCILPAGAAARNLEQGIKVGTIVVVAVGAAAVTIATGGTAGAGAALLVVEVVGATIETVSTANIQQAAVDFLNASNRCKDASCAETMIKDNFQRLANMQNDFAAAEVNAIDSEMARLFGLVPETSALYNGSKLSDNQLSMFSAGSWEPEQVWRAVGVALQMTTLFTSIGKWVLGKAPRLAKTTAIVTTKMQKALPAATNTTKALAAHTDDAAKLALGAGDDATKLALGAGDDAMKALPAAADDALKALPAPSEVKALPAHVDDEVKALTSGVMEEPDAKKLQDIAQREAKRRAGTASKHDLELEKTDNQLRNQIYNKYENVLGSRENVEMAGKAVMQQKQIAIVEAELADAQKELKWGMEHTSQITKTDLATRQAKVDRITQQLADMGVTYNKVDDAVDAGASVARSTNTASSVATTTAPRATEASRIIIPETQSFAEIGVRETIVDGRYVYTDLKTGKELSEIQVLNKMPTSWNEEMAKYGLRQVELSNGSVRYMDISASGGNKFISQEAGYNRVGEILSGNANKANDVASTLSKVDNAGGARLALPAHVDDVANTANKVDDAARNAGRVADATADAGSAAGKADDAARAAGNAAETTRTVQDAAADAARKISDLDSNYKFGQGVSSREDILRKWGLSPDATDAQIKKRYRELAMHFHEDKLGGNEALLKQAKGIMADINAENEVLTKGAKISDFMRNGANYGDDVIRTTGNTTSDLVRTTGETTDVITDQARMLNAPKATYVPPVTNVTPATSNFSTWGHDLIGIMAGIRAGDRASQ